MPLDFFFTYRGISICIEKCGDVYLYYYWKIISKEIFYLQPAGCICVYSFVLQSILFMGCWISVELSRYHWNYLAAKTDSSSIAGEVLSSPKNMGDDRDYNCSSNCYISYLFILFPPVPKFVSLDKFNGSAIVNDNTIC